MGISISLLSWSWVKVMKNKILGLAEAEAILKRSISFSEKDAMTVLRSLSFKRSESSKKITCNSPKAEVMKKSLSFSNWETGATKIEDTVSSVVKQDMDESVNHLNLPKGHGAKLVFPDLKLPQSPVVFSSPRPLSELDAAAIKVQKVYKSYRTRRNLADCAVVIEELWWKALDFASLKHSSVSFFNVEKPETASSRWARARTRVAKVGKGLSKDEKAQKLALRHWLEAIDPRHRYGHNLSLYYDIWSDIECTEPFFYWLDVGDGREINLEKCPRSKLQSQCIKYLGPNEREEYEVIVEDGKLVYRRGQNPVNTTEGSKWIFVLSTSRTLYVGKKQKGTFQHSSFLAGGATTAAGRLVAKEGVLEAIWPYSGHYLPTEENFKEFISYLQDHKVDLSNVKRCSIDDDEYPSTKKESNADTVEPAIKVEVVVAGEPSKETSISSRPTTMEFERRLSCKWTNGTGPRIGCVRDYPAELQSKALEQVNLSPRVIPSPMGNRVPIPSPRPSPKVRLSPRLQYMGIPTPKVSLTLPKHRGN